MFKKPVLFVSLLLAASLMLCPALATTTFTDAHGNQIELDTSLESYAPFALYGADNAARKNETNLGDLWTDALYWFAASGRIDEFFEEDDVLNGSASVDVPQDHIVALWNGGNLRADIPAGRFNAETLAQVLPYPNKVAVVYMTGAQLTEALEAASQGLPFSADTEAACASFMQVSGVCYTVDLTKGYDAGEPYGDHWFKAASLGRVTVTLEDGTPVEPDELFAVITSNANFNGMDSSYIFKQAAEENERSTITTAVVRDVIWMYLNEALSGRVPETYAEPAGRIVLAE